MDSASPSAESNPSSVCRQTSSAGGPASAASSADARSAGEVSSDGSLPGTPDFSSGQDAPKTTTELPQPLLVCVS